MTCHFAEGSQALGCHVRLSFSKVINISRVNESLITHEEIKTHFPAHCYQSQLYVYDWEADGTVGTLPIPVETVFSESALAGCETVTPATRPVNQGVYLCSNVFMITVPPNPPEFRGYKITSETIFGSKLETRQQSFTLPTYCTGYGFFIIISQATL